MHFPIEMKGKFMKIGVQTKNAISDDNPHEGYELLKKCGFDCVDFSLNSYLTNTDLYKSKLNKFFDKSDNELEKYFSSHKKATKEAGIIINQMHMPYPNYVPNGSNELNNYLRNVVAPKSMNICRYLECKYIVIHGFKLAYNLGSEQAEWEYTEAFLHSILPYAKENDIKYVTITQTIKGDVNNDGAFDVSDIVALQLYVLIGDFEINMDTADLCSDGKVNIFDLMALKRYCADVY